MSAVLVFNKTKTPEVLKSCFICSLTWCAIGSLDNASVYFHLEYSSIKLCSYFLLWYYNNKYTRSTKNTIVYPPGRPQSVLSDHAPLSPQSSTASSGSASDCQGEDGPHPVRNTFMEEGSGMRGEYNVWDRLLSCYAVFVLVRAILSWCH